MYSNQNTAQFADYVTKAELADWDEQGTIFWLNPPFSLWESVATKLLASRGHFLCLIPDWGKPWVLPVLQVCSRKWYIPSSTSLFEIDGTRVPPTKWGCWLLELPSGLRTSTTELQAMSGVTILPWNQSRLSVGRKRRDRSKAVRARLLQ